MKMKYLTAACAAVALVATGCSSSEDEVVAVEESAPSTSTSTKAPGPGDTQPEDTSIGVVGVEPEYVEVSSDEIRMSVGLHYTVHCGSDDSTGVGVVTFSNQSTGWVATELIATSDASDEQVEQALADNPGAKRPWDVEASDKIGPFDYLTAPHLIKMSVTAPEAEGGYCRVSVIGGNAEVEEVVTSQDEPTNFGFHPLTYQSDVVTGDPLPAR